MGRGKCCELCDVGDVLISRRRRAVEFEIVSRDEMRDFVSHHTAVKDRVERHAEHGFPLKRLTAGRFAKHDGALLFRIEVAECGLRRRSRQGLHHMDIDGDVGPQSFGAQECYGVPRTEARGACIGGHAVSDGDQAIGTMQD